MPKDEQALLALIALLEQDHMALMRPYYNKLAEYRAMQPPAPRMFYVRPEANPSGADLSGLFGGGLL